MRYELAFRKMKRGAAGEGCTPLTIADEAGTRGAMFRSKSPQNSRPPLYPGWIERIAALNAMEELMPMPAATTDAVAGPLPLSWDALPSAR